MNLIDRSSSHCTMADDGESSGAEDSCRLLITIDSWLLRSKPQEPVPTEIATTIGDLSPPGDDDDAVRSPTSPAGPRKKKRPGSIPAKSV